MGSKKEPGYLRIGEAAERAQLTQRTLRYYEEKGLLPPPTRMEGRLPSLLSRRYGTNRARQTAA